MKLEETAAEDRAWFMWAIRQTASQLGKFSAEHHGYVLPSDIVAIFEKQFPWLLDGVHP